MTRGKKADSAIPGYVSFSSHVHHKIDDIPKNHLNAIMPDQFLTLAANNVALPKQNIMIGSTRCGPYFLPSMPTQNV